MTIHNVVVNTILSFNGPFTYGELFEKLRTCSEIDLSKDETYSQVLSKVIEIFELPSIKVVPFSSPIQYYVVNTL